MPSAAPSESQDASPSPSPNSPTALAPGPRAAAFNNLYSQALTSTLKSVSYESFSACFPSIAESAPGALISMHSGLVSRLEGFARDEFETIMRERAVVERLNALEDVIADAKRRQSRGSDDDAAPIPPHTLAPSLLVSAHLSALHKSQQSQLNAKLQTTQSQNASLAIDISRQRQEIEELLRLTEALVGDLESSGVILGREGDGPEGLSAKARAAEFEMSGV